MSFTRCNIRATLLRAYVRPGLPRSGHKLSLSTATTQSGSGASSHPSTPPRRSFILYTALLTTGVVSGLVLSLVVPRPRLLSILYPVPTPAPDGVDTVEGIKHARELERQLQNLAVVQRLRNERIPAPAPSLAADNTTPAPGAETSLTTTSADTDSATSQTVLKYSESRPYSTAPPGPHSLTGYSLRGPGKFALPPLVFSTADKKQGVFVIHIGAGLCGHEGITHGGLLGTLLDECLGRTVSGQLRVIPQDHELIIRFRS